VETFNKSTHRFSYCAMTQGVISSLSLWERVARSAGRGKGLISFLAIVKNN
jgi:hypothetical protein